MDFLLGGIRAVTWRQLVMYVVGIILIWLIINKEYEPSLLLPMGFGAIMMSLPMNGVLDQLVQGKVPAVSIIQWLYKVGIESSGMMPSLLFISASAVINFGPLLSQPLYFLFGAAAQFGIFAVIFMAALLGSDLRDAASISIVGMVDDPTSILVLQVLNSAYIGPITIAVYSYIALVSAIQPFVIKLVTTKKEHRIRMSYNTKAIPKSAQIAFPIAITMIVGFTSPQSVALVGFLMFDNLLRECGVLDTLSQTAQNQLVNLITLLLGITISLSMRAEQFMNLQTLTILALGPVAFIFDAMAGVLFVKLVNVALAIFHKPLINPMIDGCGISAFPMSSRVMQKLANEKQEGNIILIQTAGTNIAGQVASATAGGLMISIVSQHL